MKAQARSRRSARSLLLPRCCILCRVASGVVVAGGVVVVVVRCLKNTGGQGVKSTAGRGCAWSVLWINSDGWEGQD